MGIADIAVRRRRDTAGSSYSDNPNNCTGNDNRSTAGHSNRMDHAGRHTNSRPVDADSNTACKVYTNFGNHNLSNYYLVLDCRPSFPPEVTGEL